MALTEAERSSLADNQFAFDGSSGGAVYVRHLPCDTGIYLGEPEDVQKALDHLPECPTKGRRPTYTFRGQRPWPKGTAGNEAKKEAWLARIDEHPQTTDEDYDVAVSILVDAALPLDEVVVARLENLGFVAVNSDGSIVAKDW